MNAIVGLALVWAIGISFLTAWLADQRGRSYGAWWFLGFLFGPLALLAVGLAPTGLPSAASVARPMSTPTMSPRNTQTSSGPLRHSHDSCTPTIHGDVDRHLRSAHNLDPGSVSTGELVRLHRHEHGSAAT